MFLVEKKSQASASGYQHRNKQNQGCSSHCNNVFFNAGFRFVDLKFSRSGKSRASDRFSFLKVWIINLELHYSRFRHPSTTTSRPFRLKYPDSRVVSPTYTVLDIGKAQRTRKDLRHCEHIVPPQCLWIWTNLLHFLQSTKHPMRQRSCAATAVLPLMVQHLLVHYATIASN